MKRAFQIRFLTEAGLLPDHYLLDIGCGTLRGGIPLIEHLAPGHYFGLDSRENILEEARLELRDARLEHKRPQLIQSPDLAAVRLEQPFDFIWAFSVLIHMKDDILHSALRLAERHLAERGAFYANVNFGDREDGSWQGFPVVFRSFEFYQTQAARHRLRVTDLGTLASVGHNSGVSDDDNAHMLKLTKS